MKVKAAELKGQDLDWAITGIEKLPGDLLAWSDGLPVVMRTVLGKLDALRCEFSSNMSQGGEPYGVWL